MTKPFLLAVGWADKSADNTGVVLLDNSSFCVAIRQWQPVESLEHENTVLGSRCLGVGRRMLS